MIFTFFQSHWNDYEVKQDNYRSYKCLGAVIAANKYANMFCSLAVNALL